VLLRKRALDQLEGDDFTLRKRALDLMEGDGFGFEKRALDNLEGDVFVGLRRRRALDSLEGEGFGGFHEKKRALDMLEGDGFDGMRKRSYELQRLRRMTFMNLDENRLRAIQEQLARGGAGGWKQNKRALDALEGNSFGF